MHEFLLLSQPDSPQMLLLERNRRDVAAMAVDSSSSPSAGPETLPKNLSQQLRANLSPVPFAERYRSSHPHPQHALLTFAHGWPSSWFAKDINLNLILKKFPSSSLSTIKGSSVNPFILMPVPPGSVKGTFSCAHFILASVLEITLSVICTHF